MGGSRTAPYRQPERGGQRRRPRARTPSSAVGGPAPSRPAVVALFGPDRTTSSGRITAGAGASIGASFSTPGAVAAQAVTNRMNCEAKLTKTNNPRIGPNAAPLGEPVTLLR